MLVEYPSKHSMTAVFVWVHTVQGVGTGLSIARCCYLCGGADVKHGLQRDVGKDICVLSSQFMGL